ncbi:hypothetical protein CVT25_015895, partial [Psilocybe cyanescens]
MASQPPSQTSQPVSFTTTTQYPLPSQKFMIPTAWKRYQLSQLVNKALGLEKPVPFDFLVRGAEVLRTSLSEWCAENGVGEEETLEIEYIESVMPPQKMSDYPHEDWVSAVSCQIPGYFITASYDGHLRAFDYSKKLVVGRLAHSAPITSLCVVPSPSSSSLGTDADADDGEGGTAYTVATASHDLTAQLLRVTLGSPSSSSSSKAKTKALATMHLHTAPVNAITASPSGARLLTAGWDGLVGVWDAGVPERDEVEVGEGEGVGGVRANSHSNKRRKLAGAGAGGEEGGEGAGEGGRPRRKAPVAVLKSHVGRVSKAVFREEERKALSCGFDATVRMWDVEYGSASEKPFLDMTTTSDGHSVLAVSADRTMSLYDLRSAASATSTTSLRSASAATFLHPATPSCVSACAGNAHQAVTGAYDGVVRVWDGRSAKGALATFRVEGGKKVLGVHWSGGVVGVCGEGGLE